jgi:hypothetical protein
MEFEIALNQDEWTDISHLNAHDVFVTGITLKGSGSLRSCLLTFSKEKDYSIGQKDLFFFEKREGILVPHKKSVALDQFRFCGILILTGDVGQEDELILHVAGRED